MKRGIEKETLISPLNLSTCVSYALCGDEIIIRLLGLISVGHFKIQDIREFRQAARGETSLIAFALNEMLFYFWKPAYRSIYRLRTRSGKCYFLKLDHCRKKQLQMAIRRFRKPIRQVKKAA